MRPAIQNEALYNNAVTLEEVNLELKMMYFAL